MGKLIVAVAVNGQKLGKVIPEVDDHIILDDNFFSNNIRKNNLRASKSQETLFFSIKVCHNMARFLLYELKSIDNLFFRVNVATYPPPFLPSSGGNLFPRTRQKIRQCEIR